MTGGGRTVYPPTGELDELVQRDPERAIAVARRWLVEHPDARAGRATVMITVARAAFETGEIGTASRFAHQAVAAAEEHGEPGERLAVGMSASAIIAESGDIRGALDLLDTTRPLASGGQVARWCMQRAYILCQAGRLTEALAEIDAAERPDIVDPGDRLGRLRLRNQRGVVLLQMGRLSEAADDFGAARAEAHALDQTAMLPGIVANLALTLGRMLHVGESIELFDEARHLHAAAGNTGRMAAVAELDRIEILLRARMPADAVRVASEVVATCMATGGTMTLGDAQLLLAEAQLQSGSPDRARRAADIARECFAKFNRIDMIPRAAALSVRADLARARPSEACAGALVIATEVIGQLAAQGWLHDARELRLACIRASVVAGAFDVADDHAAALRAGARGARRDERLVGCYAEAVHHLAQQRPDEALTAALDGLAHLEELIGEAATLEARFAASSVGDDLTGLAAQLAVLRGEPELVLQVAERTRARAVSEALAPDADSDETTHASAGAAASSVTGEGLTIVWTIAGTEVWAVATSGSHRRLVHVADLAEVVRAVTHVRAWLERGCSDPDASPEPARRALTRLDDLLEPVLDGFASHEPVVISPIGPLAGVPWQATPSLEGRIVVTVPNLRIHAQARLVASRPIESIALVVGPDIEHADIERAALRGLGVNVHEPARATIEGVRAVLEADGLVHLAAHGSFRADRPLLSQLLLADGASDLAAVLPPRVAARVVVLSSCEAGDHGTSGSELLGLATVLLARGAGAVVAPLVAVRELECAEFLSDVYSRLSGGAMLGQALADARREAMASPQLSRWAVGAAFACYGSGTAVCATG